MNTHIYCKLQGEIKNAYHVCKRMVLWTVAMQTQALLWFCTTVHDTSIHKCVIIFKCNSQMVSLLSIVDTQLKKTIKLYSVFTVQQMFTQFLTSPQSFICDTGCSILSLTPLLHTVPVTHSFSSSSSPSFAPATSVNLISLIQDQCFPCHICECYGCIIWSPQEAAVPHM